MKKISSIFLLCIYLLTLSANAENVLQIEKIKCKKPEMQKEIIDTSDLMCDTPLEFGNGMYLQVDGSKASIPDKYKEVGFSNSPMYVYDMDLNLIKTIEFDDYVSAIWFIDGTFYFTKIVYGTQRGNPDYKHYKGKDFENIEAISEDEYTFAVHTVKVYGGMKYTWKQYEYEQDEMTYITNNREEYLVDSSRNMHLIKREEENLIYNQWDAHTDEFGVCVIIRRSDDNFNDLSDSVCFFSLDGVSMFEIPKDSNMSELWSDDIYLYIGINEDNSNYYRIPLKQMRGFVKVKYNDTYLSFKTPPVIENDYTLVPMRFLFEQMGAEVEWDGTTQTATVKKNDDIISFSIDNTSANVNNTVKTMDVPPRLINGKTMIPLRFLSEELGYTVEWDNETRTAIINE